MKTCSKCGNLKPAEAFNIHSGNGKPRAQCSICVRDKALERVRTLKGLIGKIYTNQRSTSKIRVLGPLEYTRSWLASWLVNQVRFRNMFKAWKRDGYKTKDIPTVDRIHDMLGYTKGNIQVLTWEDNLQKAYEDIRNGNNTKTLIAVYPIKEGVRRVYPSIAIASRQTTTPVSHITATLSGKCGSAGGYVWGLHNEY